MDYELTLTIRNGPMLARMREYGYTSIPKLSDATGISITTLYLIAQLKLPLYVKSKSTEPEVRGSVQKLADHFCCTPQEIYPEAHWYDALDKNKFIGYVNQATMEAMTHKSTSDPAVFLEYMEERVEVEDNTFDKLVSKLRDRDAQVLRWRFADGLLLREIGEKLGVSTDRVRQIEARALRNLRAQEGRGESKFHELLGKIESGL